MLLVGDISCLSLVLYGIRIGMRYAISVLDDDIKPSKSIWVRWNIGVKISHTWTPSCTEAAVEIGCSCFKKCLKIYASVYLVSSNIFLWKIFQFSENISVFWSDEREEAWRDESDDRADLSGSVLSLPLCHLLWLC